MLWIYIQKKTRLLTAKQNLLWLSPEKSLGKKLGTLNNVLFTERTYDSLYKSFDKAVQFEPNSIDVVMNTEQISNSETDSLSIVRILNMVKPGGWAFLNAPVQQLTNAGFIVNTVKMRDVISDDDISHFGFDNDCELHICFKPETVSLVDQRYALKPIRRERAIVNERVYVAARFI